MSDKDEEEHKRCPEYVDFAELANRWTEAINTSRANNPFMHNQPYLTVDPKNKKEDVIEQRMPYLWDDNVDFKRSSANTTNPLTTL